jgi:hypothetical protein
MVEAAARGSEEEAGGGRRGRPAERAAARAPALAVQEWRAAREPPASSSPGSAGPAPPPRPHPRPSPRPALPGGPRRRDKCGAGPRPPRSRKGQAECEAPAAAPPPARSWPDAGASFVFSEAKTYRGGDRGDAGRRATATTSNPHPLENRQMTKRLVTKAAAVQRANSPPSRATANMTSIRAIRQLGAGQQGGQGPCRGPGAGSAPRRCRTHPTPLSRDRDVRMAGWGSSWSWGQKKPFALGCFSLTLEMGHLSQQHFRSWTEPSRILRGRLNHGAKHGRQQREARLGNASGRRRWPLPTSFSCW